MKTRSVVSKLSKAGIELTEDSGRYEAIANGRFICFNNQNGNAVCLYTCDAETILKNRAERLHTDSSYMYFPTSINDLLEHVISYK